MSQEAVSDRAHSGSQVRSPKSFKDISARNWVSDAGGVLTEEQVCLCASLTPAQAAPYLLSLMLPQTAETNRILTKLHRDLGVESAVVTLDEIIGVRATDDYKMRLWCVDLFNHWGVGGFALELQSVARVS